MTGQYHGHQQARSYFSDLLTFMQSESFIKIPVNLPNKILADADTFLALLC
jgi:hypothetical protein